MGLEGQDDELIVGFKAKFCYDNVMFIRRHLDDPRARDVVQDWQIDMMLTALEFGRITAERCTASQRVRNWIHITAENLRKAGLR